MHGTHGRLPSHARAPRADAASKQFGADRLHEGVLALDDASFAQALSTYRASGDKTWLEVAVTRDGTTHERCGVRLKGNSTLRRLDDGAGPEQYPWLIRLDRVVGAQDHHGVTEVVLRANNSASSLNEAVALDRLAAAGLASQDHGYAAVRVGDTSVLRLVLEHPGDTWADRVLPGEGILYTAEATGDYTYRSSDPASYDEVFDQERGTASRMTVVAWDHNLTFGVSNRPGGQDAGLLDAGTLEEERAAISAYFD